jgi:hypothetical protein
MTLATSPIHRRRDGDFSDRPGSIGGVMGETVAISSVYNRRLTGCIPVTVLRFDSPFPPPRHGGYDPGMSIGLPVPYVASFGLACWWFSSEGRRREATA